MNWPTRADRAETLKAEARAIADRDTANRKERIRQALRAGHGAGTFGAPIQVDVDRRGNATITSGRHRAEVLREPEFAGRKLPAVFRRSR